MMVPLLLLLVFRDSHVAQHTSWLMHTWPTGEELLETKLQAGCIVSPITGREHSFLAPKNRFFFQNHFRENYICWCMILVSRVCIFPNLKIYLLLIDQEFSQFILTSKCTNCHMSRFYVLSRSYQYIFHILLFLA